MYCVVQLPLPSAFCKCGHLGNILQRHLQVRDKEVMNKEICAYLVFCLNLVNSVITDKHFRVQFLHRMSYLCLKKVNIHSDIFVYVLQNYLNVSANDLE